MSGPKHLWAGDWEHESELAGRRPAARQPEPVEEERARHAVSPSRRTLMGWPVLLAVLALAAGAAFGLGAVLSSGHPRAHSSASLSPHVLTVPVPQPSPPQGQPAPQQSAPPSTPAPTTISGPAVYWDGMEIDTISPGLVVIDTVQLGSLADRSGLEPGEQLVAVNGHQLGTAADIAPDLRGLHTGQQTTVEVAYGSSTPQTVALALGAPPSKRP